MLLRPSKSEQNTPCFCKICQLRSVLLCVSLH